MMTTRFARTKTGCFLAVGVVLSRRREVVEQKNVPPSGLQTHPMIQEAEAF